ncbi:MAG: archease [Planctomycetes bacterium]|nr:archease [Planctomycetota bacterium]
MYETFEHTADLGLRIRAADLDTLFVDAAHCLLSAIVEDAATIKPTQKIDVNIAGEELEFLLFDWLRELLYHFDAEHLLFGRFEAHVTDAGLTAAAWGEPLDRSRHTLEHEVKAITYHGLRVEKVGNEWIAEVIVDI